MLNEFLGLTNQQFLGFFLAFLRIVALVSVAPIFGSQTIPVQIKIFLSLFLATTVLPIVKFQVQSTELFYTHLFLTSIKEIFIGAFLGFCTKLIFEGFQFAGRLIGNQMGIGMAELIDPESGSQASPIGNFLGFIAIVLFLQLNAHHFIIRALHDSFHVLPIDSKQAVNSLAGGKMLSMFSDIFTIAIKLVAPPMVVFSLMELSMGIMARLTPQMNIFFVGLPIRLGVGLLILITSLPVFYLFFESIINSWKRNVEGLILTF